MKLALKIALCKVAAIVAPVVTLFYRKGIWLTPDDLVSPFGQYEEKMRTIYTKFGTRFGDWWWLAVRNRAYGLSYKLKPDHFKNLTTYDNCVCTYTSRDKWYGQRRFISVDGHKEVTYSIGRGKVGFHVITGYRLRPVFDQWYNNNIPRGPRIAYRPINMDARPILSIRAGTQDD